MKISGNTVFISGGSAGIGLEIAKQFSDNGNKVIINGRDKNRLENALKQLNNAVAIQGDLSIETERIRIANELIHNYPDLNVIVNNAGKAHYYTMGPNSSSFEKAKEEITTNYFAIIHFTELLLQDLLAKPSAAIINITSIAALRSNTVIPTYAASKAALHSYTQALRSTLKDLSQLEIYEVLPPLVDTEFAAVINLPKIQPKEVADELFAAMSINQYDVPVGITKAVHSVLNEALQKLNQ